MIPNPTQDPIGLAFDQVWPQRSKYNNRDHFRQVLHSGRPYQYHGFQHSYPDGTCRSFTLQARRINWGDEAAVLVILWDITDLKDAENQLRSAALFPEQNPNPVLRLSLDGHILYANPASRQLLPEYQPGEPISAFWQAIVKGAYQRGKNRLIDFECLDRAYVFQVVPIPDAGYINLYGRDITERKRAAEALAAAHRQNQSIIDNTPDIVYALDLDERFILANIALAELLHTTPEQMIGKKRHEFMPKGDADWHEANDQQVVAAGKALEFEEYSQLNGRSITWLTKKFPLRDAQGSIYAVAGISADISERKRFEQELSESEERYRLLHENMRDAFVQVDLEGKIIEFNDLFCQMLGYSPQELRQLTYQEITPEGWHEYEARIVREQIMTRGYSDVYTKEYRRKDGTVIPVELRTILSRDSAGQPIAMWAILRDITERKQVEAALQESNRKYQELVRYAPAGIYEVDFRTRRYTSVNDVMCELTGYTRDELLRMDAFELLDEEGQKLFQERIQQWLAGIEPSENVEYRAKTKDGRLIDTLLSVTFKRDQAGNPVGATVIAIDITARKQAEQALREALQAAAQSEERFRALAEQSPDAIMVNLDGRYVYANPVAARLLAAQSPQELLGLSPFDILEPEFHEPVRKRIESILRKPGTSPLVEVRWRRLDGSLVDVEVSSIAIRWNGKPAIQMIIRDITARKQAEESSKQFTRQLQETQNYLENLFNYANAPIIVWDPSYTITRFNHAFEHLTGYSAEEVLGKKLDLLFDADSREESLVKISRTTSGEYWESVEIPIRRKDGINRIALWNSANIYAEDGKTLQATIAQGQDITERKKAETEAHTRQMQIELQRRLLDQREQDRLEIARDLHDGPLQEITAAALTLQRLILDCTEAAQLASYDAIQTSLRKASSELRGYAQELRSPVLAQFGLEKAIQSHLESIQEKHPELAIHFEDTHYEDLLSQPVRLTLYRIYQQALTNIFKHSGANQITIHLVNTLEDVTLRIQDNGSGFEIPDDWLELARAGHLGLVGMRERAEAIGGTFTISSTTTSGTTIQVTVPLSPPPHE